MLQDLRREIEWLRRENARLIEELLGRTKGKGTSAIAAVERRVERKMPVVGGVGGNDGDGGWWRVLREETDGRERTWT